MSNSGSTKLLSKAVATSIISLKTPTQVGRSSEISTTLDRSASVILNISFPNGVIVGGVVCHPAEIRTAKFGRGGGANKILGPEFCNWYQKFGGRKQPRLARR